MKSNSEEFSAIISQANAYLKRYIADSQGGFGKVVQQPDLRHLASELRIKEWIDEGGLSTNNIGSILEPYLKYSQRMHHPHYIGHQVAVPHLASGIADFIHGAINNPMAIYEMGPSAATIEKVMINWMLLKIGWLDSGDIYSIDENDSNGKGVFTHGGSMANLTALLAARAQVDPLAWSEGNSGNLVILTPASSHYSISRAISIMGLGQKSIVKVKVNKLGQMDTIDLETKIIESRNAGYNILAVTANACVTATGIYDEIKKIGEVCQKYEVWLHVDGAHGTSAILSDKYRFLMDGLEYADSLIWDTHKMLRTTTLSAAVLLKKGSNLNKVFQQDGSYLFHEKEQPGVDFMHYALECTKAGIATKLFWVLAAEGEKGLANFVENQYDLSHDIAIFISSQSDFELFSEPQSNIICFRYSKLDESNEFQLKLRNELVKSGEFYITCTEINHVRYLRLTVMNPLTTIKHIKLLLQKLREIATKLVH